MPSRERLPLSIKVHGSGRRKLDGVYVRMRKSGRRKPCYVKRTGKEPMYLYWLDHKWKIGYELDSKKAFALSRDHHVSDHPCHPSRIWRLYNKEEKEYVAAPAGMSVEDAGDQAKVETPVSPENSKRPESSPGPAAGDDKLLPSSPEEPMRGHDCVALSLEDPEMDKKVARLDEKIRAGLERVADPGLRLNKVELVKAKVDALSQYGGISKERTRTLIARIENEFMHKRPLDKQVPSSPPADDGEAPSLKRSR